MATAIVKLAGVGVAVAALGVGAPYICGMRFESQFRESVTELSAKSPFPIKLVSYERGIFSANAETQVEIPASAEAKTVGDVADGSAAGDPTRITIRHTISHGPRLDGLRLVRMVMVPAFEEPIRKILAPVFKDQPVFEVTSDFGFTGTVDTHLHSPAVETTIPAGDVREQAAQLNWQGFDGDFRLSDSGRKLDGGLKLPGFAVVSAGDRASMDGIAVTAKMFRSPLSRVWLGESDMTIDNFGVTGTKGEVKVEKLLLRSSAAETGGLVSSSAAFSAESGEGMSVKIVKPTLRFTASNLDGAALQEFSERVNAASKSSDASEKQVNILTEMKTMATRMAKNRPLFKIEEFSYGSPDGPVKADGQIQYIGSGNIDTFAPQTDLEGRFAMDMPLVLFDKLFAQKTRSDLMKQMSLQGQVPEISDEQVNAATASARQSFIDQKLMMLNGDRVSSTVEYRGGAFTVNGAPFPPAPPAAP